MAAQGINDKGTVVGVYEDSTGVTHGFIWNGKTYKSLMCREAL